MLKNSLFVSLFMSLLFFVTHVNSQDSNQFFSDNDNTDSYFQSRITNAMKNFNASYGSSNLVIINALIASKVNFNIPFGDFNQTILMLVVQSYWVRFNEPCLSQKACDPWINQRMLPKVLDVPGINVNLQDAKGKTALIYLVEATPEQADRDVIKPIQMLLDKGADINLQDNEGKTAVDYATNEKVKNFLLEKSVVRSDDQSDQGKTVLELERELFLREKLVSLQEEIEAVKGELKGLES